MSRTGALAQRLREVLLDGRWIANTNFREQIEALDVGVATRRHGDLNSIALLVYHINYYLAGLINAFETGRLEIRDAYSFDMPPLPSEEAWQRLIAEFIGNASRFAEAVEQLGDEQLEAPFIQAKYGSYERNIEGVIEHSYYHLGQVVLLRKLQA